MVTYVVFRADRSNDQQQGGTFSILEDAARYALEGASADKEATSWVVFMAGKRFPQNIRAF